MNKTINIAIEELKKSIAEDINNSGLPIGVIKLIVDNIANEITILNSQQVAKEMSELNNASEGEKGLDEPCTSSEDVSE